MFLSGELSVLLTFNWLTSIKSVIQTNFVTFFVCFVFHQLMSYASGTKYIHGNLALTKGLSFAVRDPSMGDASLSISLLSPAQSATYQCKVKKSPGVDTRKVSLVVMGKTGLWVASWG